MLIRKLNNIDTNADPNCNVAFPPEVHEHIAGLPDVVALKADWNRLAQNLRDKYGTIMNAPKSDSLVDKYVQAQKKHRAKMQFHRARWRSQQRQNFFARKDASLIAAQLNGDDINGAVHAEQKAPTLSIPERTVLASLIGSEDMRSASMREKRAAAVQTMADLCSRVECKRPARLSRHHSNDLSMNREPSKTNGPFPMQCQTLQCIFCLGDELLQLEDRTRIFAQQHTLGRHVIKHLKVLNITIPITCPHPMCKVEGITVNDVQHLKNHVYRIHGIRLQTR